MEAETLFWKSCRAFFGLEQKQTLILGSESKKILLIKFWRNRSIMTIARYHRGQGGEDGDILYYILIEMKRGRWSHPSLALRFSWWTQRLTLQEEHCIFLQLKNIEQPIVKLFIMKASVVLLLPSKWLPLLCAI